MAAAGSSHYDVIIVGGGPAGLSAALILGRCLRRVLVCDSGRPRNRMAERMHGFLTRDGAEPAELQRLGRAELEQYGVEFEACKVLQAGRASGGFEVALEDGRRFRSRRLLLATGVSDILPNVPGLAEHYGRSVHHCPYCDGYEHRGERIVAYGRGDKALGLAMALRTWTGAVTACTEGAPVSPERLRLAAAAGIQVREARVLAVRSREGRMVGVELEGGECLPCEAFFFNTGQVQRSHLPELLGCRFKPDGGVQTSERQCTDVPGLYVAGDADKDVQFVIVAAAEGAVAAVAINRELQDDDLARAAAEASRTIRSGPAASRSGGRG
jgi:thioredoxin reductase